MNCCKTCAYCFETTIFESKRIDPTVAISHPVIVRHCHRYAPRPTDERWPKVDFSEWCGEYVERCDLDRAV